MSIFAAAFVRTGTDRHGNEVDVAGLGDLDAAMEAAREAVAGSPEGETTLLLVVEADDEWFGILRADDRGEPQVFLSDVRVVPTAPAAALLARGCGIAEPEESEPERAGRTPLPRPGGDSAALQDMGVGAAELLDLALSEGLLPSDALAEIAERVGFTERFEALRG